MIEFRAIPRDVLARQTEASDPQASVWVAANAGSGKTHVLAQRVIRLLLGGCEPGRILCLTFTKAAAANMAKRVFDNLARWTALDDAALDDALRQIGVNRIDSGVRAHARRLFAAALDTPGGLKVQTIHAFCTRLLHQFPFEANVAARFTVLEERAEAELIDKLRLEVVLEAAADANTPLGRALGVAITAAADQTFAAVVDDAIAKRDTLMQWIDTVGGVDAAVIDLSIALGVDPKDTIERVNAEIVEGPNLPSALWEDVAARFMAGSANDRKKGECLCRASAAGGEERVEAYLDLFLTGIGKPRDVLVTRKLAASDPELAALFDREDRRLVGLIERRRAVLTRERTAALITIAAAVINRYRVEKERRGLLDYDDLIDRTLTMLTTVGSSWVHYKLDRGIDHVLIDEAQDTSPKQWEVVRRLVAEFTAGEGARAANRTIFAVGDEKQSIFSFQGAAPDQFAEMRRRFEAAHRNSRKRFVAVDFQYSFRSAPVVLEAVDRVFAQPEAFRGLTADPVKTVHEAVRARAPGLLEVWPLVEPDEKREIEAWDAPFDVLSETSPVVKLASTIAARVASWIGREYIADLASGEFRPARAGDILILVRQRGPLFEAVIRALKIKGVAVAGADRLKLTEHIAVMDLMVLADTLLLPADDLALATVLKSPLFGFDDDDIFALAWSRRGSLRAALAAGATPKFAAAAVQLERWAEAARRERPFAFYAGVLGRDGGRGRMLERLGFEAADALDEFLTLALDYETRETPSLQGFVAWLRATPSEVKRDMEIARDEVRVMTVHGAKGLEAPIVILADTTTEPAGPPRPRLLKITADGSPGAPVRMVWPGPGSKESYATAVRRARDGAVQADENEYRRLLYVAMTRASDRLIVCGATGQRKPPDGCWYDLVRGALEPIAVAQPCESGERPILRLQKGEAAQMTMDLRVAEAAAVTPPAWLTRVPPTDMALPIITPSDAAGPPRRSPTAITASEGRQRALARGILVHRLLQSLPEVAAEHRAAAARRYLERAGGDFSAVEREALAASILALLEDYRFAALATARSWAEVPIVGRLDRAPGSPVMVSGQIDRLAVTDSEVLIADYKTDQPAPRRIEDVPESYLVQLALYRAVLARLYPGYSVRAILVWTDVPDFMEIPGQVLDLAVNRVTRR